MTKTKITLYQRNYSSPNYNGQNPLNKEGTQCEEVDMYTSKFQFDIFLRSFFASFFFSSFIGIPFLLLLKLCPRPNFFKNYASHCEIFAMAMMIVLDIVSIAQFKYGILNASQWDAELYNLCDRFSGLIIFSLVSAAVQAYCNQKLVEILKTRNLNDGSLDLTRFRIAYFSRPIGIQVLGNQRKEATISMSKFQKDKGKNEIQELKERDMTSAIQTTICRLNIDMSLYYLSFFEKTPENLLRKLKKREELAIKEEGDFLIFTEKFDEHEILKKITKFECDLFHYKYCTKSSRYDGRKAFAYTLALNTLFKKKKKIYGTSLMIRILYAAIFLYKVDPFALATDGPVYKVMENFVVGLNNFIPYFSLGFFIFQGIKIMNSKYFSMQELRELMSTERRRLNDGGEKSYPTLNILDSKSLEAWMRLRKIFMHLYDDKFQGIVLAVTIVLIIELIILVMVGLVYFQIIGSLENDYSKQLIETGLQCLLFMAAFFIFMFYAAKVNAQFKAHHNIIENNKQTTITIFNYFSDCTGKDPIYPGTYIHNEGLRILKNKYPNLSKEPENKRKKESREPLKTKKKIEKEFKELLETEKKMLREESEKLLETYHRILEEFNHEESQNPIKLLGVPITNTVVKSFGTLLVSVTMPLLKKGANHLLKAIQDKK